MGVRGLVKGFYVVPFCVCFLFLAKGKGCDIVPRTEPLRCWALGLSFMF